MVYNFSDFKQKLADVETWLKHEFSSIRTGRASPSILDAVSVESYGSRMHINQIASVTVEDARSIRIVPWDMGQLKAIEKAINDSELGLSLSSDERGLRVHFPELTSERRETLIKVLKQKQEEARVSVRKEREKIWEDIQKREKNAEIDEDEKFRLKEDMQRLVDDANRAIDELSERKEKDILN